MTEAVKVSIGDTVKFQGLTGKVVAVDYDADRITIDVPQKGAAQNYYYGHVSQFRPVLVESAESEPAKHEAKDETETDGTEEGAE